MAKYQEVKSTQIGSYTVTQFKDVPDTYQVMVGDPVERRFERLAALEHERWIEWSKSIAHEVSPECRERWAKLWVPYNKLPVAEKCKYWGWARKVLGVLGN